MPEVKHMLVVQTSLQPNAKSLLQQGRCPFCGSSDVMGDSFDCEVPYVTQAMDCLECHRDWTMVYTLSEYRFCQSIVMPIPQKKEDAPE